VRCLNIRLDIRMKRVHGWQVADAGPPGAGKTDSAELATNIQHHPCRHSGHFGCWWLIALMASGSTRAPDGLRRGGVSHSGTLHLT
jgi:hypothetical protein